MMTTEQANAVTQVSDDVLMVGRLMTELNLAANRAARQQSLTEVGKAYDALYAASEMLDRVRANLFLLSQTLPDDGE